VSEQRNILIILTKTPDKHRGFIAVPIHAFQQEVKLALQPAGPELPNQVKDAAGS
jgi:hypothetical protein